MISKILIANRGEIAIRIIRACKEMGIETVTVFSEADRNSLHVSMADESYCIGPARVTDSYLNKNAILSVAAACRAQAIHPGYGLLSENAEFALLCEENGFIFIGPSHEIISKMGDKNNARQTMIEAGVPVVPGSEILENVEHAKIEALRIGYPLLIKASAGGGGRGIRRVNEASELVSAYNTASAEAKAAFGNGSVYMEKLVYPAKHIETQILGDSFGHAVCLGERECSVQRKNQKMIEESPSPSVGEDLRAKLIDSALKAAKAVNYCGAGTIEFLLDESGNYYFMEMNTRLQVEHPVTEYVSGIDLVQWQIRIASGIALPFSQGDIKLRGHSVECRINAENPRENYRPSSGKITLLHVPGGPGVRFDSFLYQGCDVPPFYDSMIGKLIVYASDREQAIRKMSAALCELVIEGVNHNAELQMDILTDPQFIDGTYSTSFMEGREPLA